MFDTLKLFDLKDIPSLIADYLAVKLKQSVNKDFKRKTLQILKLKNQGVVLKKVASDVYDLSYKVNNKLSIYRARFNDSDIEVFDQVILREEYASLVKTIREKKIIPKVLIDCGANLGYTTMYLSSFFEFDKILLIEPNKSIFELLEFNVNEFVRKLGPRFIIERKGIWIKNTRLKMKQNFRDKKAWAFSLEEDEKGGDIEVTNFPELIKKHGIDLIDILKIDIEGAEATLFSKEEYMKEVMSITKFIVIEIHDEFNCRDIIEQTLIKNGFEIYNDGETTIGSNLNLIRAESV